MAIKQPKSRKQSSRKRKTERSGKETNNKKAKHDINISKLPTPYPDTTDVQTLSSPLRTSGFNCDISAQGFIDHSTIDFKNASFINTLPVITTTLKPAGNSERVWRPWLPIASDVKRCRTFQPQATQQQNSLKAVLNCASYLNKPILNSNYKKVPYPHVTTTQGRGTSSSTLELPEYHKHQLYSDNPWLYLNQLNKQTGRNSAVQVSTGFELFKHPVKLMWPKSKAYDYMYREGQQLLDAFPVQAAISLYDDGDSNQDQINIFEENMHTVPSQNVSVKAAQG
ncbi:uncharacterized protein LOC143464455 [Clavelina lepadiformis]|uniref:Uncharacterized protein n=1 Tax=Clavelina lepadiformis TaxID=159417 RepID=A0ABP0F0U5_CLALP